jgi:hypothetical protein
LVVATNATIGRDFNMVVPPLRFDLPISTVLLFNVLPAVWFG